MKPDSNLRLLVGSGILALSVLLPLVGIPLVAYLSLPTATTASISGALLLSGELLGIISVAVMGKPGYTFIKGHISRIFNKFGPPQHVSLRRHRIGLAMFCIPILFGWLSVYTAPLIHGFTNDPLYYALAGDLLFIAGLFVLCGKFWDKLQSLFRHDGEAETTDLQDR
jgi:hypothetical protein